MSLNFQIYYHKSLSFAEYVRDFSNLKVLADDGLCTVELIPSPQQNAFKKFAELPAALRRLYFFAQPDAVICLDDGVRPVFPIFAFEVSDHVMARDHWIQRFSNLVGCAQEGVPGAYVMAGEMPNRPKFTGVVDPNFYYAYEKVIEIHQTPFYIATWPATDGANLDRDPDPHYSNNPDHNAPDLVRTFEFLNLVIDAAIHGRGFGTLMRERLIVDLRDRLKHLGFAKIPKISDFERLSINMPHGEFLSFSQVGDWLKARKLTLPSELPDRITKRQARNLIFSPRSDFRGKSPAEVRAVLVERIEKHSGDPYTPQPLVFDYLFCRLGETPYERDCNLIIDLTVLRFSDIAKYHKKAWENSPLQYTDFKKIRHIPTYTMHLTENLLQTMKNFLRLYAFAADIIVFSDAVLYF